MKNHEYPVIGFGLEYTGQLINCEAVMKDNYYDVLFDGEWIASIAHNDNWEWIQDSGAVLPGEIVAAIGLKIESHYE